MTTSTDKLFEVATQMLQLSRDLTDVAGKLAQAGAAVQQISADIAEEQSKMWNVDVAVSVGVRPGGQHNVVVKK
ncbi:hypothetical protein EK21DRAFT_80598 [Setomelanomma holmii]|uniref:Uncharacterized protein n=1 Tax=Setomelanomma holmii TaxID=210430 RepID=A0A9P4GY15_9PLEO|nr:hypothetical protein EK21DRAFT_80598 [Setomelanomma holmii]